MRGHGEGTITKRIRRLKDGREVVRWQAAVTAENGKRVFRYASTFALAQIMLRQIQRKKSAKKLRLEIAG